MSKPTSTENGPSTPEVKEVTFDVVPPEEAKQSLEIYGANAFKLELPKGLPKVDFIAYGKRLATAMEMGAWRVGDYAKEGLTAYGMSYEEMAAETGMTEGFLRNCKSVSERVPAQYRIVGMEKMRLMLGRKGEKETIAKLVKRLGKKTQGELRKMGASGGGGGGDGEGSGDDNLPPVTAGELYKAITDLLDMMENFPTADAAKMTILAGYEQHADTGGQLRSLAAFSVAIADQLDAEHPAAKVEK